MLANFIKPSVENSVFMLEYLLLLYLMGSVYILWYKDLKNIFKPGLTDNGSLVEESSICNLKGFFSVKAAE